MDDEGWEARMAARAKENGWRNDQQEVQWYVSGYGKVDDWDAVQRWSRVTWQKRLTDYRASRLPLR